MEPVPSLLKLCLPLAVENLKRGLYRDHDYELVGNLSQLVFDKLHKPNHPLPDHIAKEVQEKFNVANLVLGRNNFDDSHVDMVKAQIVQKLEILDLKNEQLMSSVMNHTGSSERTEDVKYDILLLLRIILNEGCRETLGTFKISGNAINNPRNLIEKMSYVYPYLKVLHMNGCDLDSGHLDSISKCYPHLAELSIGYTKVDRILGKRNFSGLKMLCIAGLKFQTLPDLSGIGNLKQLVVLDISCNDGSSNTAELLANSDITFPHLKLLDCSGNSLSDEILRKLCTQHPNLVQVPVIKTKYDRDWYFSHISEKVKFLTVHDLAACNESLEFYKTNVPLSDLILQRAKHFFGEEELNFQAHDDIKKSASLLAGILENYHQSTGNQAHALDCLVLILRYGGIDNLTEDERKAIANAVFTAINFAEWTEENNSDDGCHNVIVGMWLFSETTLLENSNIETDLFELCHTIIQKLVGSNPKMLELCISVLGSLPMPEFSTEENHVKRINALQLHLLGLLKVINSNELTDPTDIVGYLFYLHSIVPSDNESINEQYIDLLLTNLTQEWENEYGCMAASDFLRRFPKETRLRIFTKTNFDNIVERLTDFRNPGRVQRAIVFLLTEYVLFIDENLSAKPFDETLENDLVGDILYWHLKIHLDGKPDLFSLFDWIASKTEHCIVGSWAIWVHMNLGRFYK
ncbi:hypothetical protein CAEBREN_05322 [Caenorhabditis brenneri]|uniref:Uncharacterized protein n=1 Tax=Caenorhabditis brenneri TaxID=135651 RepID=G0NNA4_CAEBE|nr:hypothetical protein CAEBREN_05322 [Caenorhabditis brenneri]